jgi:cytoskeleton protein RodZ
VGEFGDKFRKAREKKGISFDDASQVTKIGTRMLQAIEEENFDRLPGGVFNKGFIRAYAKHLGLNEEDAITSYLACVQETQIAAHQALQPPSPESRPDARHKRRPAAPKVPATKPQTSGPVEELPELQLPRADHVRPRQKNFASDSPDIPWRIIAVAILVIVLAIVLWMRRSHNSKAAAVSTPSKTAQSVPLAASESLPRNLPPQIAPSAGTATPASAAPAAHPATVPAASSPTANDNNDVTVHTSQKPNPNLSESSAPSLTLVIRAVETSWISLTADGQRVGQETLIAPAHTTVRAHSEITVKVGNAAGITFLWNGQEIPADGAESEVKTYLFDSTGMHVASPAQPPAQN